MQSYKSVHDSSYNKIIVIFKVLFHAIKTNLSPIIFCSQVYYAMKQKKNLKNFTLSREILK